MKKKIILLIIKIIFYIAFFTALIILGFKGYKFIKSWLPSFEKASLESVFEGISEDYTYFIVEGAPVVMENPPMIIEGKIYLPVDYVINNMNSNFYWDFAEGILTYTTKEDVIRMKTDELTYYVNDTPLELKLPILMENQVAYIPVDIIKKFSAFEFTYNENLDLLMMDNQLLDAKFGTIIEKEISLRIQEDPKTPYIKKMVADETVKIYGESEKWYQIRTREGYIGYVLKEDVGDLYKNYGITEVQETPPFNDKMNYEGKVNVSWHQVTNMTANGNLQENMVGVTGLDVLSPTWFSLSDSEGNVANIADVAYVEWAHQNGYQVWALFSNSFNKTITHDVLSSTEKREKVIKQILAFCSIYELDGINIDFESVAQEDGEYYIQFMRELTPYLKGQGVIVSVDMYVPAPWTEHYNRPVLGELVDYFMIMAYDEHWSTSPESGSVASIGFVEEGIVNTLKSVPKEKILLGVPFYTRVWREELLSDGTIDLSSKAYGMQRAYDVMLENDTVFTWNEEIMQYYGEFIDGTVTYKCWLEDERSMEMKMELVEKYDLAGVASWKLTLQKDEIWNVISSYLK